MVWKRKFRGGAASAWAEALGIMISVKGGARRPLRCKAGVDK